MRNRALKVIIIFIMIISLTVADFSIIGRELAIAVYDGLENQAKEINNGIYYDVYFKENGNITHSINANIQSGTNLYLNIKARETGISIENAVIEFKNSNFKLGEVSSSYIKNINYQENKIELNEIIYGTNLELELPITFEKTQNLESDYFSRENIIELTGNYKKGEEKKQISGSIKTQLNWSTDVDITIAQNIEKYISLEKGVLVQENLTVEVVNNVLPKQKENIEVIVPQIEGNKPDNVTVIKNGEKLLTGVNYDSNTGIITIDNNNPINNNKIIWKDGKDIYKIVYVYGEQVEAKAREINIESKVRTQLYSKSEIIEKDNRQTLSIEPIGNIVSIKQNITENQYKGYMYASVDNETTYEEISELEISNVNELEKIEFSTLEDKYIVQDGATYNIKGATYFKETNIDKNQMIKILGEEGNIVVYNEQGIELANINKDSETNENGEIVVSYDTNTVKFIKIVTSKPISEGNLNIYNKKAITGKTGYTKEQLKGVIGIEANSQVIGKDLVTTKSIMNLKETRTEANISLNNNNLSTLQKNTNFQIVVDLKTDSNQYDLYKNPIIQIQLPQEVEKFELNSNIQKLYGDEFIIEEAKYNNDTKVILLKLKGEQTTFGNSAKQGPHIVIDANITLDKLSPSKQSKVKMTYTNENGNEAEYVKEIDVNIVSKDGILMYTNISGYNDNNEVIETIESKLQGKLQEGITSKVGTTNVTLINNYDNPITDISIIGRIPNEVENVINEQKVKSTFITKLTEEVATNYKNTKIYYSQDLNANVESDSWKENIDNIENIRAYKIVFNNNEIKPAEKMSFSYKFNIPENLNYNESTYVSHELYYSYLGQQMSLYSIGMLETTKIDSNMLSTFSNTLQGTDVEILEGINAKIIATTAGKELKAGEEVKEGQVIKYLINITNNSGKDITNLSLIANHTNAIFYGEIKKEAISTNNNPAYNTYIVECPELTEKTYEKEILRSGESINFEYEFAVKETENLNTEGKLKIRANEIEETEINLLTNKIAQSKLKLTLRNALSEDVLISTDDYLPLYAEIKNIDTNILNNVIVEIKLPENTYVLPDEIREVQEAASEEIKYEITEYDTQNNILKIKIDKINKEEVIYVYFNLYPDLNIEDKNKMINVLYQAYLNDEKEEKYYSNEIIKEVIQTKTKITVEQSANVSQDVSLKDGNEITFETIIKNNGAIEKELLISDILPKGLYVKEASYEYNSQNNEIEITDNTNVEFKILLKPGESIKLVIAVEVNLENVDTSKDITNEVSVTGESISESSNILTFKLESQENEGTNDSNNDITGDDLEEDDVIYDDNLEDEYNPDEDDEELGDNDKPGDNENPGDNDDPSDEPGEDTGKETITISGLVWVDKNKDGKRDDEELGKSGVKVTLVNSETGEIVKYKDNKEIQKTTDKNGKYEFTKIELGKYFVVFEYDINKYRVTQYRKEQVDESMDSDVIFREIQLNGKKTSAATTDTIEIVKNNNINNLDAGLIENEIFDLRLDKYVTRLIVQNNEGTTVKEYNNEKLAKVEIKAKNLVNSTVLIEYTILLTNEGELEGYVQDILDYIPNDLKFSSEINKDWYVSTEGTLHNIKLANEKIAPGETKEVKLTLTKTMNSNNTGIIINSAEIGKSSNTLNIADIDSTPANNVDSEDDKSKAEVIVSVSTGTTVMITTIMIVIGLMSIIGIGIYTFKRKEVENE